MPKYEIEIPSGIDTSKPFAATLKTLGFVDCIIYTQNNKKYTGEIKPIPAEPEKSLRISGIENKMTLEQLQQRVFELERKEKARTDAFEKMLPKFGGFIPKPTSIPVIETPTLPVEGVTTMEQNGKTYVAKKVKITSDGYHTEWQEVKPHILTYEEWVKESGRQYVVSSFNIQRIMNGDGFNFEPTRVGSWTERMLAVEYCRYLCRELGITVERHEYINVGTLAGVKDNFYQFIKLLGSRTQIIENLFTA